MTTDYWRIIEEGLKNFWKPGQEIFCTTVYRQENGQCNLCGHTPIIWHHVLLNSATKAKMVVGSECVINFRKVIQKLGDRNSILYFEKNRKAAEYLNTKHPGTAEIIPLTTSLAFMRKALSRPNDIDYKTLKPIMDYTARFESGEEYELFHQALDIYVQREFYMIDAHEDYSGKIGEPSEIDVKAEIAEYWNESAVYPAEAFEESSVDELCSEGMAPDDIDWSSYNSQ